MAARLLCSSQFLYKSFQNLSLSNKLSVNLNNSTLLNVNSFENHVPILSSIRNTSFFNKCKYKPIDDITFFSCGLRIDKTIEFFQYKYFSVPADQLWKGVVSVSNAGRKRGRGKGVGKKMSKDLNRGQVIGVGKSNMLWPGLNAPIIRGRELVQQQKLPPDPER